MPGGGLGSIDKSLATELKCKDRDIGLDCDASAIEIYFNLGMDRVHYVPQMQHFYFADSVHFPVLGIIKSVFDGLKHELNIEQLFLDSHGYYKGAKRINLDKQTANTLLVALRLRGIKISIAADSTIKSNIQLEY